MAQIMDMTIDRIALVKSPANQEDFKIVKANELEQLESESEADAAWRFIEQEFDKWSATQDEQLHSDRNRGKNVVKLTREQRLAKWITKDEKGRKLYTAYLGASHVRTPGLPEPITKARTLREYGEDALDKIVERIAKDDGISTPEATVKATKVSKGYQGIYSLLHECQPLDTVDYSQRISKSKQDAISRYRNEIDRLSI